MAGVKKNTANDSSLAYFSTLDLDYLDIEEVSEVLTQAGIDFSDADLKSLSAIRDDWFDVEGNVFDADSARQIAQAILNFL